MGTSATPALETRATETNVNYIRYSFDREDAIKHTSAVSLFDFACTRDVTDLHSFPGPSITGAFADKTKADREFIIDRNEFIIKTRRQI